MTGWTIRLLVMLALLFPLALSADKGGSLSGKASDPFGDNFLPVEEAFPFSQRIDGNTLHLQWAVTEGYYLYRGRMDVAANDPDVSLGEIRYSDPGKRKQDPYFGEVTVFEHPVSLSVPVQLPEGMKEASLTVSYQGCAVAGLCYPPQKREVLFLAGEGASGGSSPPGPAASRGLPTGGGGSAAPDLETAGGLAQYMAGASLAAMALIFYLLGLGLTFTPCVLPMVPIVATIVSGSNRPTTGQAFFLSLSYVLGMALTYAAAGVVTGLLGASFNLQAQMQSPWVLGTFAALFVLLGMAMFGLFDLQLPAGLRERLENRSSRLSGGRLGSVFGIGALSALIVSPCVSAPLAGALLYIGATGDATIGGTALLALGLGMGTPLILVGVGGRRFIPRSGPWMNAVKAVFGVMMLAVAIWLLERILPGPLTLMLWGLLLAICGVQLGAFDAARPGWERTFKGSGLVLFVLAVLLFVGALSGAKDPLRPLAGLQGGAGEASEAPEAHFQRTADPARIQAQLEAAAREGQPVMLDFYADWCISCKVMERDVFSQPKVAREMARYRLLQVDVTDNTQAHQELLERYTLFGPPAILFFDTRGREIRRLRVLGEMDDDRFLRHLEDVAREVRS